MVKINSFEQTGILPVINIPKASYAVSLAEALRCGGVNSIEVTLRSPDSLDSIRNIKNAFPDMTVGAGTVLTADMADNAVSFGADFVVSPGFEDEAVEHCMQKNISIVPGCATASEIQNAVKRGLKVVKFFPAEKNGGVETIKLLSGPFPGVKFLPTGGIHFENLGKYLACPQVIACGGSYMATKEQILAEDYEGIIKACQRAVDISLGFELAHVGINANAESEALRCAETISGVFRMQPQDRNSAVFAGTAVEVVKTGGFGQKGHVGFYTNSIPRALAWFSANGIPVREDGFKYNSRGEVTCAYLADEIGGFAFHVVARS